MLHTIKGNAHAKTISNDLAFKQLANSAKLAAKENRVAQYLISPKLCLGCGSVLPYHKRTNIYCTHACSATDNNTSRTLTEESKTKISHGLRNKVTMLRLCSYCGRYFAAKLNKCNHCNTTKRAKAPAKPRLPKQPKLPYSPLYRCTCKVCATSFLAKSSQKFCSLHPPKYQNKDKYKFRFNVYHYPDMFDLNQLQELGFYAPGGKVKPYNPAGMSRDHKVSVDEAVRNNYDPYYIAHPMNCELMLHTANNKKKTKSSITYSELIATVNDYDAHQRTH